MLSDALNVSIDWSIITRIVLRKEIDCHFVDHCRTIYMEKVQKMRKHYYKTYYDYALNKSDVSQTLFGKFFNILKKIVC